MFRIVEYIVCGCAESTQTSLWAGLLRCYCRRRCRRRARLLLLLLWLLLLAASLFRLLSALFLHGETGPVAGVGDITYLLAHHH